jgi:hypothetical protein
MKEMPNAQEYFRMNYIIRHKSRSLSAFELRQSDIFLDYEPISHYEWAGLKGAGRTARESAGAKRRLTSATACQKPAYNAQGPK